MAKVASPARIKKVREQDRKKRGEQFTYRQLVDGKVFERAATMAGTPESIAEFFFANVPGTIWLRFGDGRKIHAAIVADETGPACKAAEAEPIANDFHLAYRGNRIAIVCTSLPPDEATARLTAEAGGAWAQSGQEEEPCPHHRSNRHVVYDAKQEA